MGTSQRRRALQRGTVRCGVRQRSLREGRKTDAEQASQPLSGHGTLRKHQYLGDPQGHRHACQGSRWSAWVLWPPRGLPSASRVERTHIWAPETFPCSGLQLENWTAGLGDREVVGTLGPSWDGGSWEQASDRSVLGRCGRQGMETAHSHLCRALLKWKQEKWAVARSIWIYFSHLTLGSLFS